MAPRSPLRDGASRPPIFWLQPFFRKRPKSAGGPLLLPRDTERRCGVPYCVRNDALWGAYSDGRDFLANCIYPAAVRFGKLAFYEKTPSGVCISRAGQYGSGENDPFLHRKRRRAGSTPRRCRAKSATIEIHHAPVTARNPDQPGQPGTDLFPIRVSRISPTACELWERVRG